MKLSPLFLFLILSGLFTIESFAQRQTFNQDGFYRITHDFSPSNWELFDFFINPFSPVYSTEVAVPDTSFIIVDILDEHRSIINSSLSNPKFLYKPAIYEINWRAISDDFKLPVTDGLYLVRLKAFQDSTNQELVFSDSVEVPIFLNWENIESETVLNFIKTYPGYYIPISDSLHFKKEPIEEGINWQLLGARFRDLSYGGEEDYLLSLSFKFTLNEYEKAFSSFFNASESDTSLVPFRIEKRISFNSVQIVEIKIRYNDVNQLVIQQFDSDLSVLDLEKLWKHILN